MERRLSILQRRSRDNDDQPDEAPENPRYAKHESLARVAQSEGRRRRSRSRSSSVDPAKTPRSKSGHSTPQNSLEVSQRAPPSNKRSLSEDHNHTPNKRSRASSKLVEEDSVMVVASGYSGLGLLLPCRTKWSGGGKDSDDSQTLGKSVDIKGIFRLLVENYFHHSL